MASGSASYLISSFQELKIMPGNDYNSWKTWGSDSKRMMDLCEVEAGFEELKITKQSDSYKKTKQNV